MKEVARNSRIIEKRTEGRRRRQSVFLEFMRNIPLPCRILDLGGTTEFWTQVSWDLPGAEITVLNTLDIDPAGDVVRCVVGDARSMPEFQDKEYDIVFSNSVIEHVGTYKDQESMAAEVQRVGRSYFIQTPNRSFPIEPHFYFPLFQFLTHSAQARLLTWFSLGMFNRRRALFEAYDLVRSIRLLSEQEMRRLFPGCTVYRERLAGMTKSIVSYGFAE